jgi:hypothetical protein
MPRTPRIRRRTANPALMAQHARQMPLFAQRPLPSMMMATWRTP